MLNENTKAAQFAKQVREAELKCVMFLHEHNLPFIIMDHLPKLIQSVCVDSSIAKSINIARTKATLITKNCFTAEALQFLENQIQLCEGYSLIIDETTDISTCKSLAVVIRFFDASRNRVKDRFLGLIELKNGNAETIYEAIIGHLQKHNLPIEKLVGLAADNAHVMMGNITGVQTRFRQQVPNLFVLGCVCHSIHLCASAAANKLPKDVEDFARGIYNFFSNSSSRCKFLTECQAFLQDKPQKMLRPAQTRWLSLEAVVNRILKNWNTLILVFQDAVLSENLQSTHTILNNLHSIEFKLYFSFLSYILDIVNKMNLEFQSEHCKIHLLSDRVGSLYKTILRNFITKEILSKNALDHINPSNPRNFIALDSVYFGAQVAVILSNINIHNNNVEIQNFKIKALHFYVELAEQIKSRFKFNDPLLKFISNFTPATTLSGEVPSICVTAHKYFPEIVNDIQALDMEWRLIPDIDELKKYETNEIEEFWVKIFSLKNSCDDPLFPHLSKLIKVILCLPHSSAAAERVFSQLNLLKTKVRNKLLVDTCESILHSKDLLSGNKCYSWTPTESLMRMRWKADNN